MNIQELVADLQTKCIWVGTPSTMPNSDTYPLPETWTVPVIQIGGEGAYQPMNAFRFTVMNRGVVAGPQTYANDVPQYHETDVPEIDAEANPVFVDGVQVFMHRAGDPVLDAGGNPVLLHAAGDPIMDDQDPPQQAVIPEQLAETVLVHQQIKTPVGDTMAAVAYLEAQRAAGTWLRYVEDDQGPKRPDLKFFAIKAFVESAGSVTEKRFLIAYDEQGQPFHTEIV